MTDCAKCKHSLFIYSLNRVKLICRKCLDKDAEYCDEFTPKKAEEHTDD